MFLHRCGRPEEVGSDTGGGGLPLEQEPGAAQRIPKILARDKHCLPLQHSVQRYPTQRWIKRSCGQSLQRQERCRKRAAAAAHAKPNPCRTPALGSRHGRRQPPPPARRHSVLTVSLSPARSRRGAAGIFPVLEEERRGRKKQIFVCSPANAADPNLGGSLPRRG